MKVNHSHKKDFKKLYSDLFPVITFFCYDRYLKNIDEAKDVSQKSFIKLYEVWDNFDNHYKIKSFLYKTAKNICLNKIRDSKKKNFSIEEINKCGDDDFENTILTSETYEQLYRAVNTLPTQSRQIIKYVLSGYGNKEIAEVMNISPHTVKNLKYSAMNKLKEMLRDDIYILLTMVISDKNLIFN